MIEFWLQVLNLPNSRLAKVTCNEMLKSPKKVAWPKQVKPCWIKLVSHGYGNEGLGPDCKPDDFLILLDSQLWDQIIEVWLTDVEKKVILRFCKQIKVVYGEEFYFRVNLPWRAIKSWLQVQVNCVPLRREHWNSYDLVGLGRKCACPLYGIMRITWNIL